MSNTDSVASRLTPGSAERFQKSQLRLIVRFYEQNAHMPVEELFAVQTTVLLDVLWAFLQKASPSPGDNQDRFAAYIARCSELIVAGAHLSREPLQ